MANLFLCHASEDKRKVEPIHLALVKAGHSVFYDDRSLHPGGDYEQRIYEAIEECDLFIFIASRASLRPGKFTLSELDFAQRRWPDPTNRVLPAIIEQLDLSELPSYLTAVTVLQVRGNAAVEVRAAVKRLVADRRMRFRIGANLGDVNEKADGSVFGDGVNIAARLEGLAQPGGVTVSDAVRGAVRHRIEAQFQRRWWVAIALVLACAGTLGAYLMVRPGTQTLADAPPLLSVALFPFKSAASAPGSMENILTLGVSAELGRTLMGRRVMSPDAIANSRGELNDLRAAGKDLNVRYVVRGDVSIEGDQIVVDTRLIEAPTRAQLWAKRIKVPIARLGANPDLAVLRISNALRGALVDAEVRRLPLQPAIDASALELAFRGIYKANSPDGQKDANKSKELCDDALRKDPRLAPALVCLAYSIARHVDSDLDPKVIAAAESLTRRAVALDDADPMAWSEHANNMAFQHRWGASREAIARSLQLGPSRISPYFVAAWLEVHTGRPEEALNLMSRAVEIDPDLLIDGGYQMLLCRAYLGLARYDEAVSNCEKSTSGSSGYTTHLLLAAAYAQAGDASKAAAERDRARATANVVSRDLEGFL